MLGARLLIIPSDFLKRTRASTELSTTLLKDILADREGHFETGKSKLRAHLERRFFTYCLEGVCARPSAVEVRVEDVSSSETDRGSPGSKVRGRTCSATIAVQRRIARVEVLSSRIR